MSGKRRATGQSCTLLAERAPLRGGGGPLNPRLPHPTPGTNGYSYANLVDTPSEVLQEVVSTNVLGTLLCCREALALCTEQGSGHIFCMLGAGSGGDATKKYAAYGM